MTRYAEAEPLNKRALAIWGKVFGPEHPNVALGLNNLGKLYLLQGKYPEAEPLFKRAIGIWERRLGPDHPNIAKALKNYATLLRNTNRGKEAEKLESRANRIISKISKTGTKRN